MGSYSTMSRPGSRAGPRPSWAAKPAAPSGFMSSKPSHHALGTSQSSANIAAARRTNNSLAVPRANVLFVLGGPASGKAALGAEIAAIYTGAVHLEVRALLRKVALSGTVLGERVKGLFSQGKALPATLTVAVLREAMVATASAGPFVLTDFPRTEEHVAAFMSDGLPARIATLTLRVSEAAALSRSRAEDAAFLEGNELQWPEAVLVKRLLAFDEQMVPVQALLARETQQPAIVVDASGTYTELSAAARAALEKVAGFDVKPIATLATKTELMKRFVAGLVDGSAASLCTAECTLNPPGAPSTPIAVMLDMMRSVKAGFPDWQSKCAYVKENEDGSLSVGTQQAIGTLQASLAPMGPFPPVAFDEAAEMAKETPCVLPVEVGRFELSADGFKVAKGVYSGAVDMEAELSAEATPWVVERWNKKGDLSDVGFGLLFEWLGKPLGGAPPPAEEAPPGEE